VKDLKLLQDSILHDPSYTATFYKFSSPHLDQTTPLEIIICLAQLYACISLSVAGFKMLSVRGVFKLTRLNRVADLYHAAKKRRQEQKESEKPNKETKATAADECTAPNATTNFAQELVRQSLSNEANVALRSTWEGMALFVTGVGFFWFCANSLHITNTDWIGGLPAFMHALAMMQIALVFFLFCMLKDGSQSIRRSKIALQTIEELSAIDEEKKGLKSKKKDDISWLTFERYNLLIDKDWNPFWETGDVSKVDKMAEEKMLEKETELLESKVKSLTEADVIINSKTREQIENQAHKLKWDGYQQYICFVFNLFAFYGYMMGLIAYYFDDDENQPSYVKNVKFGYANEDADWTGNFVGDAMWTIEPLFILSTPFLVRLANTRKKDKMKTD